jgi:hypothetical protein
MAAKKIINGEIHSFIVNFIVNHGVRRRPTESKILHHCCVVMAPENYCGV